jgi:ligand-binding SRPBCC domain-containing protein
MAFYQKLHTQKIPTTLENVWDFISSPNNLKDITPAYMRFEVTSQGDISEMYPGMIITYNVRPILNIKMKWMTEITTVKPMEYFVDEQRCGPYTMWHHQHHIEAIQGGVLMTDIVTYIPPMGFLGAMANSIFIEKQLKDIFDFRHKAVEEKFGIFK